MLIQSAWCLWAPGLLKQPPPRPHDTKVQPQLKATPGSWSRVQLGCRRSRSTPKTDRCQQRSKLVWRCRQRGQGGLLRREIHGIYEGVSFSVSRKTVTLKPSWAFLSKSKCLSNWHYHKNAKMKPLHKEKGSTMHRAPTVCQRWSPFCPLYPPGHLGRLAFSPLTKAEGGQGIG